jgi:ParB family chromosome partitioning protein
MAKMKTSGLGRGLDSIFFDNSVEETNGGVTVMRLSEIEPNPDQPRKEFDTEALMQLADSIAANGLIQPIVVRPAKSEGYHQIIAGERRWRAAKMAGLIEVPVVVMEADDQKASQLALIENIQRENLNPIEEAVAIDLLLDTYGITQEELSRAIGKSRSTISNAIRLLDLPDEVVALIKAGDLSAGHGKALLALQDPAQQLPVAKAIVSKQLSVRESEELVRRTNASRRAKAKDEASADPAPLQVDYIAQLAEKMSAKMGRQIKIHNTGKARRLEISFEDNDDLDTLVRRLCGDNLWDEA